MMSIGRAFHHGTEVWPSIQQKLIVCLRCWRMVEGSHPNFFQRSVAEGGMGGGSAGGPGIV